MSLRYTPFIEEFFLSNSPDGELAVDNLCPNDTKNPSPRVDEERDWSY